MSQNSVKISPPNSLLFISDTDGGNAPYPERGPLILSTPSCISVGCYPEQDGPTQVILGKMQEVDPGDHPAFDGDLETPNRAVVVSTVERTTILQAKVHNTRTHVRIWVSHPRWPDKVTIGLE
jgi:hypothetical protein